MEISSTDGDTPYFDGVMPLSFQDVPDFKYLEDLGYIEEITEEEIIYSYHEY